MAPLLLQLFSQKTLKSLTPPADTLHMEANAAQQIVTITAAGERKVLETVASLEAALTQQATVYAPQGITTRIMALSVDFDPAEAEHLAVG